MKEYVERVITSQEQPVDPGQVAAALAGHSVHGSEPARESCDSILFSMMLSCSFCRHSNHPGLGRKVDPKHLRARTLQLGE